MKVIKKKISLEQFKSRLPLYIPSYNSEREYISFENDDQYNVLTDYVLDHRQGNYNMIPCDLKLSIKNVNNWGIDKALLHAVYCDNEQEVITEINNCNQGKLAYYVLSYHNLKTIYYFFKKYLDLLYQSVNECASSACTSAIQYWETYIHDEENYSEYEELDITFKNYGGKIKGFDKDKNRLVLDNMADLVINQIFKSFIIPSDYQDYWKTKELYYSQALYWLQWFTERYAIYHGLVINDCANQTDCCDCTEYMNRGGDKMYQALTEFVKQSNLLTDNSNWVSPTMNIQFFLPNTIDDMGEFSIFSEEWVEGKDYTSNVESHDLPISPCETQTVSGGTIVTYDDKTYIMSKANEKGFEHLESCNEIGFDTNAWSNYLQLHKDDEQFKSMYMTYTYSMDDVFIPNAKKDASTRIKASHIYPTHSDKNGWVKIDDRLYQVHHLKYVEYKNTYYFVSLNQRGQYYVICNNRRWYQNEQIGSSTITFNINKVPCVTKGDKVEMKDGLFVFYRSNTYLVNDNKVLINNLQYIVFNRYVEFNLNALPICKSKDNSLMIFSSTTFNSDETDFVMREDTTLGHYVTSIKGNSTYEYEYYIVPNQEICYHLPSLVIYQDGIITGTTSSKLSLFKEQCQFTDDMGNTLEGLFEIKEDSKSVRPQENTILSLPYKEGKVNNLTYITNINGIKYYYGNLLDKVEINNDDTCKFVYYIGAILKYNENTNRYICSSLNTPLQGIKYEETAQMTKKEQKYWVDNFTSYNIYYYDLEYNIEMSSIGKNRDETLYGFYNPSTFTLYLDLKYPTQTFNMSKFNDYLYAPVFREEYKFGSSQRSQISDNIYIDRPIIKVLEKHLKLMETTTLESLELYGNGLFTIK